MKVHHFNCGTMKPPASAPVVRDNHARLAELYRCGDPDLFIVCSHDRALYERARAHA